MQYIPAPPPSPIELGLQQLFQGWGQGRAKQRQDQMVNQDLATLQSMLNPEANELDARRRYAQGLPLLQGQANQYTGETGTMLPQLLSPQGQSAMMNIAMQKQLAQILNPMQVQQMGQSAQAFPAEQAALAAQTEGRQAQTAATKQSMRLNQRAAKTDREYAKARTTAIKQQASEWKDALRKGGTSADAVVANISQGAEQLTQRAEQMGDQRLASASRTLSDTINFYMKAMKANTTKDVLGEEIVVDPMKQKQYQSALTKLLPEMERIARIQASKAGTLDTQTQSSDPLGLGL